MFKPWSSTQQTCSPLCERLHKVEKRKAREESQERKAIIAKAAGKETEKEQVILQDRAKLEEKLTKETHTLVKLRDWGKPCISCGSPHAPDFDAGHYHTVGAHPAHRYNMLNINGQCRSCNRGQQGNKIGYRAGIKERYGVETLKALLDLKTSKTHLSNWELSQLIRQRTAQVKALKEEITEITPC